MKTLELFSGTKSFSKYAKKIGYETFTIDNDENLNPDLVYDLTKPDKILWELIDSSDIIWMSPPCTTFSMASGNTHWTGDRLPKTKQGIEALKLIMLCKEISEYCEENNKIYFIENPRARVRWFLPIEKRKTIWYCQYGDNRAKPTDIWTNLTDWKGKQCHNGNKECNHEPAPRGSKIGTQGIKGSKNRGIIPEKLFEEIFKTINGSDD